MTSRSCRPSRSESLSPAEFSDLISFLASLKQPVRTAAPLKMKPEASGRCWCHSDQVDRKTAGLTWKCRDSASMCFRFNSRLPPRISEIVDSAMPVAAATLACVVS